LEGGNAEHFFIATQDRTLQQKISNKPGGAVLFATVNGIQMDMPSEKQKSLVMKSVEQRMMPGILEKRSNMIGDDDNSRSTSHRRKRGPKGPNPLSMKPKQKSKEVAPERTRVPESQDKRKRVRKSRAKEEENA
jgi:U3 small nucleolar RNA-associated protein 23